MSPPCACRRLVVCLLAWLAAAAAPLTLRAARAADAVHIKPKRNVALCLDVVDRRRDDGATLQLYGCGDGSNQRWVVDGQALRVYGTSCLDVRDGSNRNGAVLQIWGCRAPNAHQRFERFGSLLRWVGTDKCLRVADGRAGTRPQLWTCDGNDPGQAFAFVDAAQNLANQAALASVGKAVRDVAAAVQGATTPAPNKAPAATPGAAPTPSKAPATTPKATPAKASSASNNTSKLQSAGTYLGFSYISLASFLNAHPVLKPLRQALIDAAASVAPPLPPVLLAAIAMEESSGNPDVAGGLMQFTWAPTWAAYGKGDINNGRDSLFAAARYLTALLRDNDNDLAAALRAYNGNANRKYVAEIQSWLAGGFPYGPGT